MTVIIIFAMGGEAVRRRALACSSKDLLNKPILADDLIRCLGTPDCG